MEIEHERPPVPFELPEDPGRIGQRENPQITAPCRRESHPGDSCRRWRELPQTLPIFEDVRIRIAAGSRRPVKIVMDGINAGIVFEAFFAQDLESPRRALRDGPSGRSIAGDADRRCLLDRVTGLTRVVAKLFRRKRINLAMPEA